MLPGGLGSGGQYWLVMSASSSAEPSRVLVVEDEPALAAMVQRYLAKADYDVRLSADGAEAVDVVRSWRPDVVILDLGLPSLDGVEACRRIRQFSDCYVLMLTARSEEVDRLIGLSVGADDYITKPFSPRELVARVQVVLRRPRTGSQPAWIQQFGSLTIDTQARRVELDGQEVALTRTEFDLLAALASRPQYAWSRAQLLEEVWGAGWVGDDHLVDVHLGKVRQKLGDQASHPRFVETVRGHGYRMGTGK